MTLKENYLDLTVEEINSNIANKTKPVINTIQQSPNVITELLKKYSKKVMNFIWRIILMPFMPVVNAWRKS